MIRFVLSGLLFLLCGCETDGAILSIRINSLLHDDSSKTWMIESELIDGEEYAPDNINFRTVITFYNDFQFAEQPLNTLGNRPPKYGTFEVGDQNTTILFTCDKKESTFFIEDYSKKEITLSSVEEGRGKTTLRLIPLPKL